MALNDNAYYSLEYLMNKHDLTRAQAAAMVGNFMQESTFNTGARNAGDGRDGSDSIGIGQWNGDRARNLKAFGGENYNQLDTQLDFAVHELRGSGANGGGSEARAWKQLSAAGDDYVGATKAMISYERPQGWSADNPTGGHGWDNRLKWAGAAYGASPEMMAQAQASSAPVALQSEAPTVETASVEAPKTEEEEKGIFGLDLTLPEKVGGMETSKLLKGGKEISELMTKKTEDANKSIPQGGLLASRPLELKQMVSPRATLLGGARKPDEELKPWELQMAMLRGGLRGRGRV
ncbi:phage tail tip lysozyme [Agrobacterium rosae]|uniref:phage tail tip lysozyme n=1 Tax=Agrobacterium rosae TaxID=1972867 RepID=UPI003BA24CB5